MSAKQTVRRASIPFVVAAASLWVDLLLLVGIVISAMFPQWGISAFLGHEGAELDGRFPDAAKSILFIALWTGLLSALLLRCELYKCNTNKKGSHELTFEEKVQAKLGK